MGANVSIDAEGMTLDEVISYTPPPGATLPPLRFRSNIKAWRLYATEAPLQVQSAVLDLAKFTDVDASECYILLHTYRRKDTSAQHRSSATLACLYAL